MDKAQIYARLNAAYFSDDPHEKAIMDQLVPYVATSRLYVDVGASLGQYTLFASQLMPGGRILAIEADPVRVEELERNGQKWSAERPTAIETMFAAICDHDGEITFNISNSNTSGGIVRNTNANNPDAQWETITVPAKTLDSLFPGDELPDFVKVDIEGSELDLLKGATRVLKSGQTVFFIELHSWGDPAGVRALMAQYGYSATDIAGSNRVLFLPQITPKVAHDLRDNPRSRAILHALEHVSVLHRTGPLNLLEVGCMFKEDEGLSTLVMAAFLEQRPHKGRLISIEYDAEHVAAGRAIFERRAPHLLPRVSYRTGHSLAELPPALDELGALHFASLDGGAHPEVCLHEFELTLAALAPEGVILVDDAQHLAPTEAYALPRPYGKATLIWPMLLIAGYLQQRENVRGANARDYGSSGAPESPFLNALAGYDVSRLAYERFAVVGGSHRLLGYGPPAYVNGLRALYAPAAPPAAQKAAPRPAAASAAQNPAAPASKRQISFAAKVVGKLRYWLQRLEQRLT